jgi:PAS domain S-box-containing protein
MAQIEAENSRYESAKALQIGLGVLEELGVRIPANPASSDSQRLNQNLLDLLTSTPLDLVAGLPAMTDERALAASSILAVISPASYIIDPPLVPIINYQGALLTAEFGHNTWSALFYARLALVAFSAVRHESPDDELRDSVVLATQMRAVSLELLKLPNTAPSRTKVLHILAMIAHWSEPIDTVLEMAQAAYESGAKTGDLLNSAYGCLHTANHGLAAGLNLDAYRRLVDDHRQFCNRLDQRGVSQWLSMFLQTAQRFEETSPEPHRLIGAYFNEDDWLPDAEAAGDISGRHFLYVLRLLLSYHFDVDSELDECTLRSEEFLAGGVGLVSYAIFYFYSALARLRFAGQLDENGRAETFHLVDDSLRLMRFWSEATPSTFQHKADLIAAERARVVGDLEGALSHYECAIGGARASGFTHEEALANELYARFWAERGNDRFAGPLMREAHSLYLNWGARAKAEHLAKRFPNLLIGRSVVGDQAGTQILSDGKPGELDLHTVLKASQDIASEIRLDSLLARLMTNVIENTGAQQGFLILERDGRWMIEARASVDEPDPNTRATEDIAGSDLLAEGIVRYVARRQETVVLDDASKTGRFVDHRYVQAHQARSILCAPLINQGETSAILYLENNLAPGVFSPQRVSLLKMLSSQMAISIDNARIHADLERLLESRSKALASAEAQVRTLFEDSPLGIALTNLEGEFLSVNKAVLMMLRITEEELIERSVLDFYDDAGDRVALLRRVDEAGFVQDFGIQLVRHDGNRFHASMSISPLVLEGNEVLLAMVQDVTAQIIAEQETAVLEERARLARELHDEVTQTLLSASLLADATVRTAEEGCAIAARDLTKLSGLLRGALDEMRTLLLEMRSTAVRDRTLGQILAPMTEAARSRSHAEVNLRIEGDHVLPEHVTKHLQRIAQESLNNAIRHADATTIDIELVCVPDRVALRIRDNGQGFDVQEIPTGHHGLGIMRERAQEMGTVLEIHSTIDGGTEVSVIWS